MYMKRQHPTNPDLFWCPKCQAYKLRHEFTVRKNRPCGIQSWCKPCNNERFKLKSDTAKERKRTTDIIWRRMNLDRVKKYNEKRRNVLATNPELKKRQNESSKKSKEKNKEKNIEKVREAHRNHYANNKRSYLERSKMNAPKRRGDTQLLTDSVIKVMWCAHSSGLKCKDITTEMIEIKRQQIIMKRTLKQLKEWRKANEYTGSSDVQGKQQADEQNHVRIIQA